MGCGSSRATGTITVKPRQLDNISSTKDVRVPAGELTAEVKRSASQTSLSSLSRSMKSLKARKERERREIQTEATDSASSLESQFSVDAKMNERASARSSKTVDSGLGDDYGHVITEHSDVKQKQVVESEKRPSTPELCVSGVGIARKDSAKQRHLLSLSNYDVRHMSVVERPASRSGRAFDITFGGENAERKRMPAKLARLERKKKGRNELTREELEEKLRKAEERRQECERRLVEKMSNQNNKDRHLQNALKTFADSQTSDLKQNLDETMEKRQSNREAYLKNLRDKLREKENHAKVVRENKQNLSSVGDITDH